MPQTAVVGGQAGVQIQLVQGNGAAEGHGRLGDDGVQIVRRLLGGGKFLLYGDLIENQFITLGQSAWPVGSALSFILLILVLLSMAVMRRAERDSGDEGGMLW